MSSAMHRLGSQTQQTFESGSKKKFGKNLNKLQKPPAPPIPSNTSSRGGSSRNGLLLLSTKRSTSTSNSASTGMLASKPVQGLSSVKPLSSSGRTENYSSAHEALVDAVTGGTRTEAPKEHDAWGVSEKQQSSIKEAKAPVLAPNGGVTSHDQNDFDVEAEREQGQKREPQIRQDWRENVHSPTLVNKDDGAFDADQTAYMARLARERAAKRRHEEEARINEQRERAARRLRELDERMGAASDLSLEKRSNFLNGDDHTSSKATAELGGNNGENFETRPVKRTLYDPYRTFSSLVGGKSVNEPLPVPTNGVNLEPQSPIPTSITIDVNEDKPGSGVIQLSSYEDRNRGESNCNAGPRMLYDPKSGSMVAVTPRSETPKPKKGKQKNRREATSPRRQQKSESGENGKGKKGKGGRKDEPPNRLHRRRVDSIDAASPRKGGTKGRQSESRLPRTCGVLYVRDDRGNPYCADGCEGDHGYGSHSVRGGRIRNPVEHAKYLEDQAYSQHVRYQNYGMSYGRDSTISSETVAAGEEEEKTTEAQQKIEWVKRDEKIELLTGAPDSPTLQATAKAWAPSEAALAAAAAVDSNKPEVSVVDSEDGGDLVSEEKTKSDDDDDDDDDADAFIGLGFDPTANMDSVITSPYLKSDPTELDDVDLAAIALGGTSETASKSIFAFGSSTTWSSPEGNDSDSNWRGMLGSASRKSKATDTAKEPAVGPASFLSLSGTTWGPAGLESGFPGLQDAAD